MKKIIEKIRKGDGKVKLSERELPTIGSQLSSQKTVDAITDLNFWDYFYPRYLQLGATVYNVSEGKQSKVPSLAFDARMVDVGEDVPESVIELDVANLPPRRIGVSIPMSNEVIASMSDTQIISFIRAGVHAVNEEILAVLIIKASNEGSKLPNAFDASGLIALQREVNDTGNYFASSKAILKGKETPITVGGDDYLFKGDAFDMAKSFDGMYAFGSKKIDDETMIGYGNFKFSAVLLYGDYYVIMDRFTGGKSGETIFTFYQMANCGIADKTKFATITASSPVIYSQPTDVEKLEGGTLVLSVVGYGVDTYVWKKDGLVVADGGAISGAETQRLVIQPIAFTDGGVYTVELENANGITVSDNATVLINAIFQEQEEQEQEEQEEQEQEEQEEQEQEEQEQEEQEEQEQEEDINWGSINATRSAKVLMKENWINPSFIIGTGKHGRINKVDVSTYIDSL